MIVLMSESACLFFYGYLTTFILTTIFNQIISSCLSVYSFCLFRLLEQLDDSVVAFLSGQSQSALTIDGGRILLCSRGKEELHDLHMAIARSVYQGGPANEFGFVHVSLHRKQCLHALHMAIVRGQCQRSFAKVVILILVCSRCDQSLRISRCPTLAAHVRAVHPS